MSQVHAAKGGSTTESAVVHNTGCGCSKSACLKRYCECFNGGIACSDRCRCKDCKNTVAALAARTSRRRGNAAATAAVGVIAAANAPPFAVGFPGSVQTGDFKTVGTGGVSGRAANPTAAAGRLFGTDRAIAPGEVGIAPGMNEHRMRTATVVEDRDVHVKVDVGGGGTGGAVEVGACQAAAPVHAVRSPLGMLPGFVVSDDSSSSNRGSMRV